MQKILRFVSATILTIFLSLPCAFAQVPTQENMAGGREEMTLKEEAVVMPASTETPKQAVVEPVKKAKKNEAPQVLLPEAKDTKMAKRVEKAKKILNSRIGKWAVKRVAIKAERKAFKQAKKNPKLNPEELKKQYALSGNMRIAAILGIIGIILTLIDFGGDSNIFQVIGIILIVIALVLLLLELI
jgi:hypothetical protein